MWLARGAPPGAYDPNHPDDRMSGNFPFLMLVDDRSVGAIRIDIDGTTAWARRVAIQKEDQCCGYGRRMLELAMAFAHSNGCTLMQSAVDASAVGFYSKLGFEVIEWGDAPSGPLMQRLLTEKPFIGKGHTVLEKSNG